MTKDTEDAIIKFMQQHIGVAVLIFFLVPLVINLIVLFNHFF